MVPFIANCAYFDLMTEAEAVARVRPKDVSTMNNCPSMDVETSCQLVESNRSFIQVMKVSELDLLE